VKGQGKLDRQIFTESALICQKLSKPVCACRNCSLPCRVGAFLLRDSVVLTIVVPRVQNELYVWAESSRTLANFYSMNELHFFDNFNSVSGIVKIRHHNRLSLLQCSWTVFVVINQYYCLTRTGRSDVLNTYEGKKISIETYEAAA